MNEYYEVDEDDEQEHNEKEYDNDKAKEEIKAKKAAFIGVIIFIGLLFNKSHGSQVRMQITQDACSEQCYQVKII